MYLKSMKDDSVIKINNVTKQYDNVFAVKSLTLELKKKSDLRIAWTKWLWKINDYGNDFGTYFPLNR